MCVTVAKTKATWDRRNRDLNEDSNEVECPPLEKDRPQCLLLSSDCFLMPYKSLTHVPNYSHRRNHRVKVTQSTETNSTTGLTTDAKTCFGLFACVVKQNKLRNKKRSHAGIITGTTSFLELSPACLEQQQKLFFFKQNPPVIQE